MNEARIDKWLWAARIFKTRSIAADAIKNGRVTIQGVNVKPSRMVKEGEVVSGFYVTNSAYAYTSMQYGDSYARKFIYGDWFKLTITGVDAAGESTGSVDFYLADLRNDDFAYIINTWRWVDLTSLGQVKRLEFALSSSDTGQWGMNTPAYFCLDNLGGTKPASEDPIVPLPTGISELNSTATPVQHFDLNGRQRNKAVRGLNMIRMSDGSIRKMMMK